MRQDMIYMVFVLLKRGIKRINEKKVIVYYSWGREYYLDWGHHDVPEPKHLYFLSHLGCKHWDTGSPPTQLFLESRIEKPAFSAYHRLVGI